MDIQIGYVDGTTSDFKNINEIYQINSNCTKDKIDPKLDIIDNNKTYQLISENLSCTLYLNKENVSYTLIRF